MVEVVAALIWKGDRFLACQRPANKARALLWEFVGGKVEKGETRAQALVRECREELDITVDVGPLFMELIHPYPDITVRLCLFNCTVASGEPRLLEHADLRWITTDEIDGLRFCPADTEILARLKQIKTGIRALLYSLADENYKAFQAKLIPTLDPARIIGVRMPALRKMSKNITPDMLGQPPFTSYEENCLYGLKLNECQDVSETISRLDGFLPYVDNWAVCDLLDPKCFRGRSSQVLRAVDRWLSSAHAYTVRFAIGVLMRNYLGEGFCPEILQRVCGVTHTDYYVKMMAAWFFATALSDHSAQVQALLEERHLDPWVHNKTIQKACESLRITPGQKTVLRALKK